MDALIFLIIAFGIIGFGGKMLNIEAKGNEFVFSFNYM